MFFGVPDVQQCTLHTFNPVQPRRKATPREDIGKKGFYLTDFTYGLSAYTKVKSATSTSYTDGLTVALNGKLCPPLKITLPDTTVPGTAEKPVNGPLHST